MRQSSVIWEFFKKMGFRFSGFDRFLVFERILLVDSESVGKLGFDTYSPFDTESVSDFY